MNVTLELPWPPSLNRLYRHVGTKVLISRDGRLYRERIAAIVRDAGCPMFTCPVEVRLDLYPPDNRKRDADNCLKCLLDSLTGAGAYGDDSQIAKITVVKNEPMPPDGMAVIRISEYDPENETTGCREGGARLSGIAGERGAEDGVPSADERNDAG